MRANAAPYILIALPSVLFLGACQRGVPPQLRPDDTLQAELGLTDRDEVHRVTVTGGPVEVLSPAATTIPPGAWVEFVTGDGRLHEVLFEPDSLSSDARGFLDETGQMSSPPLLNRGERFVVSFGNAPEGRYPFRVEGNGGPAFGVVVVKTTR